VPVAQLSTSRIRNPPMPMLAMPPPDRPLASSMLPRSPGVQRISLLSDAEQNERRLEPMSCASGRTLGSRQYMRIPGRLVLVAAIPMALIGGTAVSPAPTLFSGDAPIAFEIKAPFTDLIADGRDTEDYSVTGTVSSGDGQNRAGDNVKVALRGHT